MKGLKVRYIILAATIEKSSLIATTDDIRVRQREPFQAALNHIGRGEIVNAVLEAGYRGRQIECRVSDTDRVTLPLSGAASCPALAIPLLGSRFSL